MKKVSDHRALEEISSHFESRGYTPLGKGRFAVLEFARPHGNLFLSCGIEKSRLYRSRFTASFYLSVSLRFGYVVRGFPHQAYERIGQFLKPAERKSLLAPDYRKKGVVDAWWHLDEANQLPSFITAIDIAEKRFLSQRLLARKVLRCERIVCHRDMLERTIELATSLPRKPATRASTIQDPPPKPWYRSAEMVLKEMTPELTKDSYIELLAVDAWRVFCMKNQG
jgi:hypothetical protein